MSAMLWQFFEMQRNDAMKALDIYRRAGHQVSFVLEILFGWLKSYTSEIDCCFHFQAEKLSEFYEVCKSLDIGRGERFIKIEQVPEVLGLIAFF